MQTTTLARDPAGRSSGFGWVTFADPQAAGRALDAMDGVEVAGTKLQVRVAALAAGGGDTASVLPPPLPGAPPLPPPPPAPSDATTLTSLAADETGGGLKLTADARAALMARLGAGAATQPLSLHLLPTPRPTCSWVPWQPPWPWIGACWGLHPPCPPGACC